MQRTQSAREPNTIRTDITRACKAAARCAHTFFFVFVCYVALMRPPRRHVENKRSRGSGLGTKRKSRQGSIVAFSVNFFQAK